jgi:hypothetical protein
VRTSIPRSTQQFQGGARRLLCRQRRLLGLDDVFQKPAHGLPVEIARVPFAVEQDVGAHPGHQRQAKMGQFRLASCQAVERLV